MEKLARLLILICQMEFLSILCLTLVDLRVWGRPVRWTKQDLCQAIPSPTELAVVPYNVLLENTTFAPFFLYRQKLELIDYFPHKTVLVSIVEDSGAPRGVYIIEARLSYSATTPITNHPKIGRFKSPSFNIEIQRCSDVDVHLIMMRDDDIDSLDDGGVTLEWHPPDADVGPVDVYITKLSFKKLNQRLRRARRQP